MASNWIEVTRDLGNGVTSEAWIRKEAILAVEKGANVVNLYLQTGVVVKVTTNYQTILANLTVN